MPQRNIYFFINGRAIVSKGSRPVRELPAPWPTLLDGSWEHTSNKPWIEVFADFLISIGEDPSQFEFYWGEGYFSPIYLNLDGRWRLAGAEITDPLPLAADCKTVPAYRFKRFLKRKVTDPLPAASEPQQ